MSQKTLFSFFTKKTTPSKNVSQTTNQGNVLASKETNLQKIDESGDASNVKEKDYVTGDLIWARLDGYPWWPALVCPHPTTKTHLKPGAKPQVHVQFFDQPPSRAWIKTKYTGVFTGAECRETERGGVYFTRDGDCLKGQEEADDALLLTREDRLSNLLVEHLPTDEEDNSEEEAEMEVAEIMKLDADIFDDEMSEGEHDYSKENHEEETVQKEASKTIKSPVKDDSRRKSAKRRKVLTEADNDAGDSGDEYKADSGSESDNGSSGVSEGDPSAGSDQDSPVKKGGKRKRSGAVNGAVRKTPGSSKNTSRIKRRVSTSDEEETGKQTTKEPTAILKTPAKDTATKLQMPSAATPKTPKSFTPSVGVKTKSKLSAFSAPEGASSSADGIDGKIYEHLTLEFLKPDKIKDADKHTRDHPDYNPRTLYVPTDFMNNRTPGHRQWWELKAKHFDVILFFKMGKFYELFHMDAAIAVAEVGLIYMKGDYAHSGFPEIAYGRYADTLVEKGYKVARIEQTETPDMMNERVKKLLKPTKFDKVVRREVCRVTSKATRVYSYIDGDATHSAAAYLLSICEKCCVDGGVSTYGVCFVDTSTSQFHIGQFTDDRHNSRLRTLISHYPPSQVLTERGHVSESTRDVLATTLPSAIKDTLQSGGEFWDTSRTLRSLAEEKYFTSEETDKTVWPLCLTKLKADSDPLGQTVAEGYELVTRALGAVIWYLRNACMDHEVMSLGKFEEYVPVDSRDLSETGSVSVLPSRMVLDGVTLANLEIVQNSNGTQDGTLIEKIDSCSTSFGKRLLKQWLCAPLCNSAAITDRQQAIADVLTAQEAAHEAKERLRKLPDLERLLSKIHTLGSSVRAAEHPDGRAIFYDEVKYSKKKIGDFLSVLDGFKIARKIIIKFSEVSSSFKSKLLQETVGMADDGGRFPDISEELEFFDNAFDHVEARSKGVIHPRPGVDKEYDQALRDIESIKKRLDEYLQEQKRDLSCRNIVYFGTAKNRYQLEIPDSTAKNLAHKYNITSQKKGYKRYWTSEIESMLAELMTAEEHRDSSLRDIMRRIFNAFDKSHTKWSLCVQCMAVLDVLLSLTEYSKSSEGVMCQPEIVSDTSEQGPFLEIRDGRHPCMSRTYSGGDFIPNDTVIGIRDENGMDVEGDSSANIVLVTGPNMGGKSTLMRQVGVIAILAQMGCYVPAKKCKMTPVDRVFTRLGANDRIMAGESTFFVELSETSSILQHATKHSLVLLDELGRGTATYDGTAIASAVIEDLTSRIACRTLFSTHYHSLCEDFQNDANVRLGHMSCMVENECSDDPSQETITFLYKFVEGACPKSYGFNAARLAELPEEIIQVAKAKAYELEVTQERLKAFRALQKKDITMSEVRQILATIEC